MIRSENVVLKVGFKSFIIHPVPSDMQFEKKLPIELKPNLVKRSAVPAPVDSLVSM